MDDHGHSWNGGYRGTRHRADISDREWARMQLEMHKQVVAYLDSKRHEMATAIMPLPGETDAELRARVLRALNPD